MLVDDLVRQPGLWASEHPESDIVISSRIRLARNLRDAAFPGWAMEVDRLRVADAVREALDRVPSLRRVVYMDMAGLSAVDKAVLRERHLVSAELIAMGQGSGVALLPDERMAIMVNEEDHIRMQVISPGSPLRALWRLTDRLDSALEEHLDYAFSPSLGYLTACPSNVGTGLRVSVMMHLSGLRLLNELEPVIKGMERIGLAVRGRAGEGSEAAGNVYQVSNQTTLGESEGQVVERLGEVGAQVVEHERNARARLMEDRRTMVLDYVDRSLGILQHARLLGSAETLDLLCAVRLGVELGLVRGISLADLSETMLLTQPGHLQKLYQDELQPDVRDELRARLIKHRLTNAEMTD